MGQRDENRWRLIKLIHVAKRELGLDDETYRALIANTPGLGGARSSARLSAPQLELLLDQLKRLGFKVRPRAGSVQPQQRRLADDPQSRMIRHLWLELHAAGAVRDPSERALASFISRRKQVESLQWLNSRDASEIIENLKQWLERTNRVDNND